MSAAILSGNNPLIVNISPGNSPPAPPAFQSVAIANGKLIFTLSDGSTLAADGLSEVVYTLLPPALPLSDAMLSAYYATRPTSDPVTAGAVWANAGILTISSAGAGNPTPVLGGIAGAAANVWLDGLPTSDPMKAGSWFNNSGAPTLSAAGAGDVSTYSGPLLNDQLWCLWALSMPIVVDDDGPPGNLSKFWMRSAGIIFRTA